MKLDVWLVLGILLVGGCATQYQRQSFTGGFDETQLAPNVYRVSFKGNAYTASDRAADFALLRCAEVTLQNGYSYFAVVDAQSESSVGTITAPTQSYTTSSATAYGYGNTATAYGRSTTTTYGGQTFVYSKPSASNTIVMVKDKSEIPGLTFDAKFLVDSLSRKYEIDRK